MAALGLPLVLLLGLGADLVAAPLRPGRRTALQPLTGFRAEAVRARSIREPATLVEAVGGGGAMLGAGIVGAASIGAVPGTPAILLLALTLAVGGGHLAASEPHTRPATARARARLLEAGLVLAGVLVALAAPFIRWRAPDLEAISGAGDILGNAFAVGPATAVVGQAIALLAVPAGTALLVPPATERPRGRARRPAAAALLVRVARWAVAGSAAAALAALAAGADVARGPDLARVLLWAAAAAAAAGLVGVAWGLGDRLPPPRRLRVLLPAVLASAAAAAVLVAV